MFIISKIVLSKNKKSRYHIYLREDDQEEKYAFSVSEDTIVKENLQKGKVLQPDTIQSLKKEDETNAAYQKAIVYLGQRMRSELEVYNRLKKEQIDDQQIEAVIIRLREQRLLDEVEFSRAFVLTKKKTTMHGPVLIRRQLMDKGISTDDINAGLSHYSEEEAVSKVIKWLEKQQNNQKKQSHKAFIQKVTQQLAQKGFTNTVIKKAIEAAVTELPDEAAYDACKVVGTKILTRKKKKYTSNELIQQVKMALYQKGFQYELIERFVCEYIKEGE